MKIDIKKKEEERLFTLRLPESIVKEIDDLKKKTGISRQKLIVLILKTALSDKGFVLKDE